MAEETIDYNGPIVTLEEAQQKGLKRYFTGERCQHGHLAERIVCAKACVICRQKWGEIAREKSPGYAAKYQKDNQDRIKKQRAERYARDPVQARAKTRAWARANPEKKRAMNAAYRLANPEKILAEKTEWRRKNPEARKVIAKRSRKKHAETSRVIVRRRRAKKLQAGGSHTARQAEALLMKQKFRCACCNKSIKKHRHLDHIQPISCGGSDDISNLQWLCPSCNQRKGAMDPFEWSRKNGRLL